MHADTRRLVRVPDLDSLNAKINIHTPTHTCWGVYVGRMCVCVHVCVSCVGVCVRAHACEDHSEEFDGAASRHQGRHEQQVPAYTCIPRLNVRFSLDH